MAEVAPKLMKHVKRASIAAKVIFAKSTGTQNMDIVKVRRPREKNARRTLGAGRGIRVC